MGVGALTLLPLLLLLLLLLLILFALLVELGGVFKDDAGAGDATDVDDTDGDAVEDNDDDDDDDDEGRVDMESFASAGACAEVMTREDDAGEDKLGKDDDEDDEDDDEVAGRGGVEATEEEAAVESRFAAPVAATGTGGDKVEGPEDADTVCADCLASCRFKLVRRSWRWVDG